MSAARKLAYVVLVSVCIVSLGAQWLAPTGYAKQFREAPSSPPSRQHLLGTDEIGRDRFARVLYGTRISLLLAPAAALISTLLAALVGGLAGYPGGIWLRVATGVTDLFLSLPWLFLLITVRAVLPLNVSPLFSVLITFLILGLLGWAASARVLYQRTIAPEFRLHRAGSRLRPAWTPALLRSCSSQPEARFVCAILDFNSCFYFERG